jgi:hypothetical protein
LLILDASGRVRQTYKLWEQYRGRLVHLRSAPKRYDPLVIHHWNRGGGKHSIADNVHEVANAIAAVVDGKPNEEWLVIHHKVGNGSPDLPAFIRSAVTAKSARVHFLPWGQHHAINDFAHVPNVVLAGTLFYRTSNYEALARAAGGLEPSRFASIAVEAKEIELGEHHHLLLQALCRASVRRADGDACPPCAAYLIVSAAHSVRQTLSSVFPGCKVVDWKPTEQALSGRRLQLVEYLTKRFEREPTAALRFSEVRVGIGIAHASDFTRLRKDPLLREALHKHGIEECGGDQRRNAFRLKSSPAFKEVSDPLSQRTDVA